MDTVVFRDELLAQARADGFAAAGIASVEPFRRARRLGLEAIAAGRMDGMPWFNRARVDGAADLARRYPWGRSLMALAWPYEPAALGVEPEVPAARPGRPRGRMAAYACLTGRQGASVDYHDELAAACDALVQWMSARIPDLRAKRFIDHGWAADRAVAERAGLGFCGKNTCLITPGTGSYVLLAEILLSVALPSTPPSHRSCGRCHTCLDACPTGAIVAPGVLDARRCISYLTIEHRGPIPLELRPLVGTWAFGCDICQEVCPINVRLAPPALQPGRASTQRGPVPWPDLVECLELNDEEFHRRFRSTAVWRAGRAGLARNAAVALGNAGDRAAIPPLERARDADPDPVVREAASWALAQLATGAPPN
jgi:epoxyqueuosine reductase